MRYVRPTIAVILAWAMAAPAAAQSGSFSSLEEQMTLDEFRGAGLEKLNDEELRRLNEWIRKHQPDTVASEAGSEGATASADAGGQQQTGDRRGFSDYRGDPTTIETRIDGSFNGWSGETRFELQNGMVWEQADPNNKLGIAPREDPKVEIQPGFLSAWYLKVEGVNKRVRVERVE